MANEFDRLVEVMQKLRGKKGCPWDREQTRESLKPFLLEEAYEVLEAIEEKDIPTLKEELGDLLFQVVFHSQIAAERGEFTAEDVVAAVRRKMIRRHPHVFAGARAGTAREAIARWEALKKREKRNRKRKSALDGIPKQLPALIRANQLQARAARVGFDWPEVEPVWKKIREELEELETEIGAGKRAGIEAELGDLFFTLVNLSRFLRVDPEEALRKANGRFASRFEWMESASRRARRPLTRLSAKQLDRLWERAKRREGRRRAVPGGRGR